MSNEIQKYQMPQAEMMEMAKLFSESKMFKDVTQIAQAFVKIQAGKEIGIAPFAAMTGINIILGKLSISANLMAGCVKGSGKYDYKVLKLEDDICSIEFFKGSKSEGISTFTAADAARAGTQNMTKFPRNMLFSRAMSNGQKWFCPDVFTMPVYTPEELGQNTEDIQHEEIPAIQGAKAEKPTIVSNQGKAAAKVDESVKQPEQPAAPPPVLITDKAIADAVDRIKKGEIELVKMIKDTFTGITESQLRDIEAAKTSVESSINQGSV